MSILNYIDRDLLPFPKIVKKILKGEAFSLARYGDGEWYAMLGYEGKNCDGVEYTPQLKTALRFAFQHAVKQIGPYYVAMHQAVKPTQQDIHDDTVKYLVENRIPGPFCENAVFHDALVKKRGWDIADMFTALTARDVVIVGPQYIRQAGGAAGTVVRLADLITIPTPDAFDDLSRIIHELDERDLAGKVVLICAGPAAPVIVDVLFRKHGYDATFIDFGSTFDPFCGKNTRSYHAKVEVK